MIDEGTENGEVQEVEQDIVDRVFSLGDRSINTIMTYRSDIVSIDIGYNPFQRSFRNEARSFFAF